MNDSTDNELMTLFWGEVTDYLSTLNTSLLELETGDGNTDALLKEMNRVAHSMKGAARVVGVETVERISHLMESAFAAAQQGTLTLTPEVCDVLYDGLDVIQNATDGEETDAESLRDVINGLKRVAAVEQTKQLPPLPDEHEPQVSQRNVELPVVHPEDDKTDTKELPAIVPPASDETVRVAVSKLDTLMAEASELLVARMHSEERQHDLDDLRELVRRWGRDWRGMRASYLRLARMVGEDRDSDDPIAAELNQLFRLMDSNQQFMQRLTRRVTQLRHALVGDNLRFGSLVDQMQEDISAMRLVSFEMILGGFQRMVRDLARESGKDVQIDVVGGSVELDKAVLDSLRDPINHLLRNAIDHGLETPDERVAAGKPSTGRVRLVVEQHGSEITVFVSDDGRGVDPDAVRASAVKSGIVDEATAQSMSEDEARHLIFHPGLTTTREVTAISGRGVGMDVVRERVEALRGRVQIHSAIGQGTTVQINVPVSLTRLRCVILRVGDERYALPSVVVTRMEKIPQDEIFEAEGYRIIMVQKRPVVLVSLAAMLETPTHNENADEVTAMVLHAPERSVAFAVDELLSEQELVLKSLGPEITGVRYIAGAALMGSGEVIIVLDANQLLRGTVGAQMSLPTPVQEKAPPPVAPTRVRVLVVDDSITTRTLEKNILEAAGYDVQVAIDGAEAWEILTERTFDIVITDVEMPHMNGLELTRRIKNTPQTERLPVILLTSLKKPEQREAGLHAGADAYLVKSNFTQAELLLTIEAVV